MQRSLDSNMHNAYLNRATVAFGHKFELSTRIVAKNDHNECETMKTNLENECIPT